MVAEIICFNFMFSFWCGFYHELFRPISLSKIPGHSSTCSCEFVTVVTFFSIRICHPQINIGEQNNFIWAYFIQIKIEACRPINFLFLYEFFQFRFKRLACRKSFYFVDAVAEHHKINLEILTGSFCNWRNKFNFFFYI